MSERSWNPAMSGGARSSRQWEWGRASSGTSGLRDQGEIAVRDEVGELRVVHMGVHRLVRDVGPQTSLESGQELLVGLWTPELPALGVRQREAAQGRHHTHRPGCLVEPLGDQLAERALLRGLQADE